MIFDGSSSKPIGYFAPTEILIYRVSRYHVVENFVFRLFMDETLRVSIIKK